MYVDSGILTLLVDPTGMTYASTMSTQIDSSSMQTVSSALQVKSELTETLKDLEEGAEAAPPAAAQAAASAPGCCGEFQFEDGFLVNTRTGAVWRYNETSRTLQYVEPEYPPLAEAAQRLVKTFVASQLERQIVKSSADLEQHRLLQNMLDALKLDEKSP